MEERSIIFVDDEKQIRAMYARAFAAAGARVRTLESAEECLEAMRKDPSLVLFLDLNLPGMNGLELCRQLHKEWPMAIMYAVTGYASLFEISDCREAGFEDYFTKPVPLAKLKAAAERAFERINSRKTKKP